MGASHFVSGGAVTGNEIYGRFPTFGLTNEDSGNNAYLPSMSVDSLGATLSKWFSVNTMDLNTVFLNVKSFPVDLGFMKA